MKQTTSIQQLALITVALLLLLLPTGCASDAKHEADHLLKSAEDLYNRGQYEQALLTLDSLRHIYPNAIEARKKGLRLKQSIALKQAQADLAVTDSALQAVNADYAYQREKVERDRANLCATQEELDMLARTKMLRDSLQVRFDVQCAKIKYIHKRQKEE